jgi:hypothetical protein
MDMSHSITWEKAGAPGILTVDLSALKRNYRRIATTVSPARAAAVVKADAYGLGAQVVAPALYAEGCRDFFVAQYAEAVPLRPLLPRDCALYVLNGLQPGTEDDGVRRPKSRDICCRLSCSSIPACPGLAWQAKRRKPWLSIRRSSPASTSSTS